MADAFTFNPDVTITPDHRLIATGTVEPSVTSLEIYEAETKADLGAAQIKNGTWSFTQNIGDTPALHFFEATSTDASGQKTQKLDYDYIETGIVGKPYKTVAENANLSASHTYWGFYSDNGTLEANADYNKDEDTFTETGDHYRTRFVFSVDEMAQTVTNFHLDGNTHDTLILPRADFAGMADLLQNTTMSGGNAVIQDPNGNATLTLVGVTKTEMKSHPGDFVFHGAGHLIPSF